MGRDAKLASTKRFGCTDQSLPPETVMGSWPLSLACSTLFSAVDRKLIHRKAASLFLLAAKMAFDSSPKYVQAPPSGARGTGTAEALSPRAATISAAEPMWWIAIAVRPALK